MTPLSAVSVNPTDITVAWDILTDPLLNGGDIPIFYQLEWSADQLTWTSLNPSTGPLILSYTHIAAFSAGSYQYYRVKAKNNVGLGSNTSYSPILSVLCDDYPSGMGPLTAASVDPTNMTITWTELSDETLNGRDLPIFYSIEYMTSAPSSDWTVLNSGGALAFNFTYVPGIIFDPSLQHLFRVRAQNGVGLSDNYSEVLVV